MFARRSGSDLDVVGKKVGNMESFGSSKRVALVACGKRKLGHQAKAKDLYTGTLFKLSIAYAAKLEVDRLYILSAKHGLLDPEQVIEPYDKSLKGMPAHDVRLWAAEVVAGLGRVANLQSDHFIFLASIDYRKYLIPYLQSYEAPLEGMRQGEQLSFLKRQTGL